MDIESRRALKNRVKSLLIVSSILFLKILEVFVLLIIIHWLFKLPIDGVEEMITIMIVFLVMTPLSLIILKQRRNAQEAEYRFRTLAEQSLVGIYTYYNGKFRYVNQRFLDKTGYKKVEIIGYDFHHLLVAEDHPILSETIQKMVNGELRTATLHLRAIRKDQSIMDIELLGTVEVSHGKPILMGSILDISERKRNERLLNQLAFYDPLTGLVNRRGFEEYFDKFATDDVTQRKVATLLFIDLDGFKNVNDSYGHEVGDCLLKEMASRLLNCVRKDVLVARFAGDEFTVLLSNIEKLQVLKLIERLMDEIRKPLTIQSYEITSTSSIGIAFFPEHGSDPKTLIKNADQAMYEAKKQGKNTYHIYHAEEVNPSF